MLLAFNSIGFASQNILFNTLDALLGLSEAEFDYTTTDTPAHLVRSDRVKLPSGDIYSYLGPTLTGPVNLSPLVQNYDDEALWSKVTQLFGAENPARARAFITDSTIDAAGDVTRHRRDLGEDQRAGRQRGDHRRDGVLRRDRAERDGRPLEQQDQHADAGVPARHRRE